MNSEATNDIVQYIKKAASASFLVKVFSLVLGFISQVIFARLLGPDVYGSYLYLVSGSLFVVNISNLGLNKAAMKVIPEFFVRGKSGWLLAFEKYSIKLAVSATLLASIIAGLFFCIVSQKKMPSITPIALLLFGALSVISVISSLYTGLLQAHQKPVMGQFPEQIIRPVLTILGIFLLWISLTTIRLDTVLVITLVAGIVTTIWLIYEWRMVERRSSSTTSSSPTPADKTSWLRVGLGFQTVTLANVILSQTDTLMIGNLLSAKDVALYGVASKIATLLSFFHTSANMVVAPLISRSHANNNQQELQKILSFTAKWIAFATLAATAALMIAAPWVLGLFSEIYVQSKPILFILALGYCAEALGGPVSYLMSFAGMQKFAIKLLVASSLVNLLLNPLFISHWGIAGSAWATTLVLISWNVIMVVVACKKMRLNPTCFPLRLRTA